jgi:hypothetical protein
MARLAERSPIRLVPEQLLITSVRHDMVDDGRRHHAPLGLACSAKRVPRQEGSPSPAPARAISSACGAQTLAVQRALHIRSAREPRRTVHARLRGQRRLRFEKQRGGGRAGDRQGSSARRGATSPALGGLRCEWSESDGAPGTVGSQVRTWCRAKNRSCAGLRPPIATGWCELRPRNRALSLAKYRAGPRRTSIRQKRTRCIEQKLEHEAVST